MQIKSFKTTRDVTLDMSEYVEKGEDASLHVTFLTSALTPAMQIRMEENPDSTRIVVESLLEILQSWDIKDGGKVVPLTFERVSQLPSQFLYAIFDKVSDTVEAEEDEAGKA